MVILSILVAALLVGAANLLRVVSHMDRVAQEPAGCADSIQRHDYNP